MATVLQRCQINGLVVETPQLPQKMGSFGAPLNAQRVNIICNGRVQIAGLYSNKISLEDNRLLKVSIRANDLPQKESMLNILKSMKFIKKSKRDLFSKKFMK